MIVWTTANAGAFWRRREDAPTAHNLEHLEMARRHLAEGRARIARQRELIGELEAAGQPTDLAEQLLKALVETLRQMRVHRDYLERYEGED